MNTYGRTPSLNRVGQQVDEAVHAPEQREDTADADDDRDERRPANRLASASRRKSNVPQNSRRAATNATIDTSDCQRSRPVAGGRLCGGRVDLDRFRVLVRHLRHAMTSPRERDARGSGREPAAPIVQPLAALLRPARLDVVEHAVERLRSALDVIEHAGPEAAACRPRPASGRMRRTARFRLRARRSTHRTRQRGCRWRSSPARRSTFGEIRDDATHAAHLALHVLGDEPLEEVDDLRPGAVAYRRR